MPDAYPLPARRTRLLTSLACGALAAAAQAAVVTPFLGRYGWDRDELYFVSASRRPTLGYIDFPPLTAWIGWTVRAFFGDSLDALRLSSLVAMLAVTVLVALMAREFGGGPGTQLVAALVWALSPYGLGSGSIFHPTFFDALCWVALLYVVLLILTRDRPQLWLLAGAIAGVGLETKYTIAFLLAALLIAFASTSGRRHLGTRWPWLGLGIACVLLVPNLIWQVEHAWPSIHFFQSQNEKTAGDTPPVTYLVDQLFLGVALVVAAVGVIWLWRRPQLRPLALVPPLVTLFFLLERGRPYYPLPADSIAVAAGTIGLGAWLRNGRRRRLAVLAPLLALQGALLVLVAPVVLPARSTASMIRSGVWQDSFYKDEIGWSELADQTVQAWRAMPAMDRADGAVVAGNYGEASALEQYARRRLPLVLSGHLSWQYWRPRMLPQRFVLFVGYDRFTLERLCRTWTPLAIVDNRWHLANEERGRLIAGCRLRQPLGHLWADEIARDTL